MLQSVSEELKTRHLHAMYKNFEIKVLRLIYALFAESTFHASSALKKFIILVSKTVVVICARATSILHDITIT